MPKSSLFHVFYCKIITNALKISRFWCVVRNRGCIYTVKLSIDEVFEKFIVDSAVLPARGYSPVDE